MNNSVFGKTTENIRNHRDIKLVTSDKRRKILASEPNYHPHRKFSEHLMAVKMKQTKAKLTKAIYLGISILGIGKTLMYKFWYNYIKPKYEDRAKLCCTDTDNFVIYIKIEDVFQDISNDVERWFGTSNYHENDKRPLPIGKNKKVPGLFKDESGLKIIVEVAALSPKTCAYLMHDGSEHVKATGTKKCVIKSRLMFENYKDCLFNQKKYLKNNKDVKAIIMICTQIKLIRLP